MDKNASDEKVLREENKNYFSESLRELEKKHPLFISVVLSRFVLRGIPNIGDEGCFEFWEYSRLSPYGNHPKLKNDARVKSLLSLFLAAKSIIELASLKQPKELLGDLRNSLYDNVHTASSLASGFTSYAHSYSKYYPTSYHASSVTLLAKCAIESLGFENQSFINSSKIDFSRFADSFKEGSDPAFKEDIELALRSDFYDYLNMPLFKKGSEKFKWFSARFHQKFSPSISSLIEQANANQKTIKALDSIIQFYEAIIREPKSSYRPTNKIRFESGGEGDQLNRDVLVKSLSNFLTEPNNKGHLTIGLMGYWGSGKTHVLNLLKNELKNNKEKTPFLFGEFNAWAYEHCENIQAGMAHEVIKSLSLYQGKIDFGIKCWFLRPFFALVDMIIRIVWHVWVRERLAFGFVCRKAPLSLVLLAVGTALSFLGIKFLLNGKDFSELSFLKELLLTVGGLGVLIPALYKIRTLLSQPFTKEFLTYLKLPDFAAHIGEVSEMRNDIRTLCDIRLRTNSTNSTQWLGRFGKKKRLLFVVDDLDRCNLEGIVKTFEAIRLVLDIPQVIVIIAIDQRIALAALAQHYDEWVKHHEHNNAKAIARDYLGKMIQLPIVLNDPTQHDVVGYMGYLWEEKVSDDEGNTIDPGFVDLIPRRDVPQDTDDSIDENQNVSSARIMNEDNEEDGISFEQLADMVSALEIPNADAEIKEGLSDKQKAAFVYWSDYYGLNNPRQLKRLENSYNLLLKMVMDKGGYDDTEIIDVEGKELHLGFGLLIALMTLEYINSEVAYGKQKEYKDFWFEESKEGKDCEIFAEPALVVKAAAIRAEPDLAPQEAIIKYLEYVNLFVLPYIRDVP